VLPAYAAEIKNYLFARQNPEDGGWGLHVEGVSSAYGTAMNYVILRLLGASEEDPRMIKARAKLHKLGGAYYGPHWAKFWLSVLGVMEWEAVNPIPPELWLLPDWVPIAPWRWWIHMRQVFLPMSYIYSKRFVYPPTPFIHQLRKELYVEPYQSIDFSSHRNTISVFDNYHPKSWILNLINFILVYIWFPYLRTASLVKRAEDWVWRLIQYEDENTDYANLAPVNAPMNTLCCYIKEGAESYSFGRHLERLNDYLWVNREGMLMNGTNGVQVWDNAFTIQAVIEAGLAEDPRWKPMLTKALEYLEHEQIRDEVKDRELCYRQSRKGAWPFSTKVQGYTVSDCTSEALKATLQLQKLHGYPQLICETRIRDAVDVLLTMQNKHSGGFASYEPQRGSELLEYLNAAEVFGRIMVEYDYPECTTAVVTVLSLFQTLSDYRSAEIKKIKEEALTYIRRAQRADGSWYGSWGICFTYAGMFALESLASIGETYENSERVKRGCDFLLSKQMADGGWGESYKSCEQKRYVHHKKSQVVQTAWACIALMEAGYPQKAPLKKALTMIMGRQQPNGEWLQEAIEGVFNCSWCVKLSTCN
jgi:lanosterol synthase